MARLDECLALVDGQIAAVCLAERLSAIVTSIAFAQVSLAAPGQIPIVLLHVRHAQKAVCSHIGPSGPLDPYTQKAAAG